MVSNKNKTRIATSVCDNSMNFTSIFSNRKIFSRASLSSLEIHGVLSQVWNDLPNHFNRVQGEWASNFSRKNWTNNENQYDVAFTKARPRPDQELGQSWTLLTTRSFHAPFMCSWLVACYRRFIVYAPFYPIIPGYGTSASLRACFPLVSRCIRR